MHSTLITNGSGISPKDQPPDCYRLLGVDRFESDPDVIASAADQRMVHVRSFQAGKRSAVSQKLLNEIAAAKVCLFTAEKKAAYDRWLRQKIVPPAYNAPPLIKTDTDLPTFQQPGVSTIKKQSWQAPAAIVLAVVLLGASIIYFLGNETLPDDSHKVVAKRPVPQSSVDRSRRVRETHHEQKADSGGALHAPYKTETPVEQDSSLADVSEQPQKPPLNASGLADLLQADSAADTVPDGQADVTTDIPEATAVESAAREPVPSDADQQDARRLVKEVYGDEHENAKDNEQKQALAKKLFDQALESQNSANRYALLQAAGNLAVKCGDVVTAFSAIDEMSRTFQVDPIKMKVDVLGSLPKKTRELIGRESVGRLALQLADEAIRANDFNSATKSAGIALSEARRARQGKLVKQIADLTRDIEKFSKTHEEVKAATKVLERSPTDPDANLLAGRFRCFVNGDWKTGLPMLALGSDATLRALAAQELQGMSDPTEQGRLADGWWKLAKTEKGLTEQRLYHRAAYGDQQAAPKLTGLAKLRVEKRLAEIGDKNLFSADKSMGRSSSSGSDTFSANKGRSRKVVPPAAAKLKAATDDDVVQSRFGIRFGGRGHATTHLAYDGRMPITIEAIVRADHVRNSTIAGNCEFAGFGLEIHEGRWTFALHDTKICRYAISDDKVTTGRWTHLAGVYDGQTLRLFVDGRLQRSSPLLHRPHLPSRFPMMLGADPDAYGRPEHLFSGTIAGFHVASGVLYYKNFTPSYPLHHCDGSVMLLLFNAGKGRFVSDRLKKRQPVRLNGTEWIALTDLPSWDEVPERPAVLDISNTNEPWAREWKVTATRRAGVTLG